MLQQVSLLLQSKLLPLFIPVVKSEVAILGVVTGFTGGLGGGGCSGIVTALWLLGWLVVEGMVVIHRPI